MERQRGKIMGMGCNHHEMMVATEKRNPVNIIFYLVKVISPVFLDRVRTPRFPRLRKIHCERTGSRSAAEKRRADTLHANRLGVIT